MARSRAPDGAGASLRGGPSVSARTPARTGVGTASGARGHAARLRVSADSSARSSASGAHRRARVRPPLCARVSPHGTGEPQAGTCTAPARERRHSGPVRLPRRADAVLNGALARPAGSRPPTAARPPLRAGVPQRRGCRGPGRGGRSGQSLRIEHPCWRQADSGVAPRRAGTRPFQREGVALAAWARCWPSSACVRLFRREGAQPLRRRFG